MKTDLLRLAILLFTACCPLQAQEPAKHSVPPCRQSTVDGWSTYVDQVHGFCFCYPPTYLINSNLANLQVKSGGESAKRQAVTFRLSHSDAYFFVWFENKPFDLQRFIKTAPTGWDSPPSQIQIGEYTFYYYGPGGGGVEYPDRYFFNLRHKTLYITFSGPYINDKTPSKETKRLESEILATFRIF